MLLKDRINKATQFIRETQAYLTENPGALIPVGEIYRHLEELRKILEDPKYDLSRGTQDGSATSDAATISTRKVAPATTGSDTQNTRRGLTMPDLHPDLTADEQQMLEEDENSGWLYLWCEHEDGPPTVIKCSRRDSAKTCPDCGTLWEIESEPRIVLVAERVLREEW